MTFDSIWNMLAVVGAATCIWFIARVLIHFLAWVERSEIDRQAREEAATTLARTATIAAGAVAAPVIGPMIGDGIPPEHVAAIAAAVAMIAEAHRVVRIDEAWAGSAWASEGRLIHQTSHRQAGHRQH